MEALISRHIVHSRTACWKDSTSNPYSVLNLRRLIDERLQAVSSRNMYSEHGLLARISPLFGHVCHRLIVSWNCNPGSAVLWAAAQILSNSFSASTPHSPPSTLFTRECVLPSSTKCMNLSVTC